MRKIAFLIIFMVMNLNCTFSFAQEKKQPKEITQQEKNEIHLDQVPEAITKALAVGFKGYSVGKVFTSSQNGKYIYTVHLSKKGKVTKVNYTAEGKTVQ